MKTKLILPTLTSAAFLALAPQVIAQQTGYSLPPAGDPMADAPAPAAPAEHYVKPSPAIPMNSAATAAAAPKLQTRVEEPMPSVTTAEMRPHDGGMVVTDDPTSGVVTEVPSAPNELPIGTLLKAQLTSELSTKETQAESRFSARLAFDVVKNGRVMLPAGTVINGRVTEVHGGTRFSGPAAIRLQPDIVKLPSGMAYELEAEVIDLDQFTPAHVNSEGTIIGNDNKKQTLTTFGATTGGGALVGAIFGGGVGAVVGAGVGAGVGTVIWLRRDRQATLPEGMAIVFSLDRPLMLEPAAR